MKALYQFLIVCSVIIFSLQECTGSDASECIQSSPKVAGYKCCFYSGYQKTTDAGDTPYEKCGQFSPDDIKHHKKSVIKRLIGGTYFTKTTNTEDMMSYFNESTFQCSRGSYISIRLLIFVSLLSLLF